MPLRNVLGALVAIVALTACDANRPGVTDPGVKATTSGRRSMLAASGTHQPSLSGIVTAQNQVSAFGAMSAPVDAAAVQRPGVGPNRRVNGPSRAPHNETPISVDGGNSRRLVAGANDYSNPKTRDSSCGNYASTDGGTTWHDVGTGYQPVTLPAAGDPATAFDANGTAYFVCLAFDRITNSSGIFVAKSRDLFTITPTTPVIITDGSTGLFNDKEFVGIDSRDDSRYRGRIYVTWTQFDFSGPNGSYVASPILISYSSNGGATWSVPHAVTPPDLYANQGSVPAVGRNGELLVAFENFNTPTYVNQVMVARSLDGGRTFERPVKVDDLFDVCPRIVYQSCSLNNSEFRVNSFPSIALGDDGTAHVVWNDSRNGKSEIRYTSSSNGGATWSVPHPVTPPDLYANQGSVPAVGRNGELLVAFENFNTPTYVNQVMVARSLDGGRTFERPVKVDDLFDVCARIVYGSCSLDNSDFRVNSFPSIAIGDDGTAHVVWNDSRNGKSEIRYTSSSNGGRRWSASSLVSPNATSGDQVFPWVTTDEDGKAHVVYYDRRDDPNNYLLNTYMSSQGGRGFGKALRVSEVSSDPYYGGFGGSFIGDYNGIAAGGGQVHPIWTDTRRHAQDAMTATVETGTDQSGGRR